MTIPPRRLRGQKGELMTVYQLLGKIAPITNTLTRSAIGSLLCMLMAEWCKANDENIIEFVNDLREVVGEVQEEHGKY